MLRQNQRSLITRTVDELQYMPERGRQPLDPGCFIWPLYLSKLKLSKLKLAGADLPWTALSWVAPALRSSPDTRRPGGTRESTDQLAVAERLSDGDSSTLTMPRLRFFSDVTVELPGAESAEGSTDSTSNCSRCGPREGMAGVLCVTLSSAFLAGLAPIGFDL